MNKLYLYGPKTMFFLLVVVALARAESMPAIDQGIPVVVRPGEKLVLETTYQCGDENCVSVFIQRTSERVHFSNSHRDEFPRTWASPTNATGDIQVFFVAGFHKDGAPNVGKTWLVSKFKIFDQTETTAHLGFADADNGGKFNSASATIKVVKESFKSKRESPFSCSR